MKKIYYLIVGLFILLVSCNQNWDDYYFGNKVSEQEVDMTIVEYFEAHPEYSAFYDMLKKTGLDKELSKDQQLTVWAVNNDAMAVSGIEDTDTLRMEYHINHLPFILSDLKQGLRIRSLNGIYFQISKIDNNLYANASQIKEAIRLKDGVLYELSALMLSRVNIYDYIKNLDDSYSIIRDTIFKYNVQKFDMANSTPVSVDKEGNTIYDSIFYVYNPLFEKAQFNSEFKQFTVFLPSNEVINNCFETLSNTYKSMGKVVERSDSTLAFQWIKEAMFYDGSIENFEQLDIKSLFNRVWRTSVQQIDQTHPVYMSNGILYNTLKLKIPNNVIISRIKSLIHYWEYQDNLYPDSLDLYTFKGLISNPTVYTGDATPKPAILPNYMLLQLAGNPDVTEEFSVEFPPLERYVSSEDGKYHVRVMEVPTGEYNLYLGFRSSAHPYVNVYFNNTLIRSNIQASLSTPWNYDRVTETENDRDPVNGTKKWDGLGGLVGVVNIDGEGMGTFRIKVEFNKLESAGAKKQMQLYHWSLKPTENNY